MQADRQRVAMVLVPARSSTTAPQDPVGLDRDSKGDTRGPVDTEKEARGTLEGCAGAAPATPWSLATRMRRARVPVRHPLQPPRSDNTRATRGPPDLLHVRTQFEFSARRDSEMLPIVVAMLAISQPTSPSG